LQKALGNAKEQIIEKGMTPGTDHFDFYREEESSSWPCPLHKRSQDGTQKKHYYHKRAYEQT
jgi:hypothetical protein